MEDKAKSLLLTDHFRKASELRQIGQRIKAGERLSFDEAQIKTMAEEMARLPRPQVPLGCRIAVWIPIVVMLALVGMLIALMIYIWRARS
jgi:hypothetical protein